MTHTEPSAEHVRGEGGTPSASHADEREHLGLGQRLMDKVMGEDDPAVPQDQAWYRLALAEPDISIAMQLVVDGLSEILRRHLQARSRDWR